MQSNAHKIEKIVDELSIAIIPQIRVGQTFLSKERNVLAFFYILYKRTRRSLRFTFFIKECGSLCVLLREVRWYCCKVRWSSGEVLWSSVSCGGLV